MIKITRALLLSLLVVLLYLLLSSVLFSIHFLIAPLLFLVLFLLLVTIFEGYKNNESFFLALLIGFLVDVFSSSLPVGVYMIIFFTFTYLVKIILKKYVKISSFS